MEHSDKKVLLCHREAPLFLSVCFFLLLCFILAEWLRGFFKIRINEGSNFYFKSDMGLQVSKLSLSDLGSKCTLVKGQVYLKDLFIILSLVTVS